MPFVLSWNKPLNKQYGVTHIYVNKQFIIGSDNGLSSDRRQATHWTNAGILLTGTSGTHFSEILIEIQNFSFTKTQINTETTYDDVMTWRRFLHCWHFVWGIKRSPVVSPHKWLVSFDIFVVVVLRLKKFLNKQSNHLYTTLTFSAQTPHMI